MLDADLAELYGVPTKRLNEQVSRNLDRFPQDFLFELSAEEFDDLRSQIATSSWGGRRYLPRAFSEQGVAMLSSVLSSKRAAGERRDRQDIRASYAACSRPTRNWRAKSRSTISR